MRRDHEPVPARHRPLDTVRAAWVLIRRFGTAAAKVATERATYCDAGGRPGAAAEWRYVRRKIVEFLDEAPERRTLM